MSRPVAAHSTRGPHPQVVPASGELVWQDGPVVGQEPMVPVAGSPGVPGP